MDGEEQKTKQEPKQYELVEVTTQTAPAIQTPEGKLITTENALVSILNKLELLVKKLV
jgi:hypothetical protein